MLQLRHLRASKKSCKETPICLRCSQEVHTTDGEECQNPTYCFHCKAAHPIYSRKCPTYQQEAKIVQYKIDNRISFGEARRELRDRGRDTYASILQNRLNQVETEKDSIINSLRKELEAVKTELEQLKETLQTDHAQINISQNVVAENKNAHSNQEEMPPPTILHSQTPSTSRTGNENLANAQQSNGRKSRKDKISISPPKDSRNRTNHNSLQTM